MTLKHFIFALTDDEGSPALGEILDALWLAGLGIPLTLDHDNRKVPHNPEPELLDDRGTEKKRTGANAPDASRMHRRLANRGSQQELTEEDVGDGRDVFERGKFASGEGVRRASPIIAPAAHTISDPLRIARSVKPLQQQRFSTRSMELDEERTAELTAQVRLSYGQGVSLALRPQRERWYDLHLILEDDPYAEIWAPMLRDFRRIMSDTGAFRSVRQWRLRLGPDGRAKTEPSRSGALDRKVLDNPAAHDSKVVGATLESTSGQRLPLQGLVANRESLILFASHGESHHWLTGVYHECLKKWANASLALLHLMPPARWSRMMLDTPQGIAWSRQPGDPAAALGFEWYLRPEEDSAESSADQPLIVPVTSVEPKVLGDWASMQMGLGQGHEAYAFRHADRVPAQDLEQPRSVIRIDAAAARRRRAEVADVALSNLRTRSQEAFELAMYLVHAPFTLPVARLVQEVMLKPDGAALATLVMSDLVRIKDGASSDKIEMTYFELTEAIREDLQSRLLKSDVEMLRDSLQDRLSAKLRGLVNREITFDVLVEDASGLELLPDWAQPFARFGTEVQRVVRNVSGGELDNSGEILGSEVFIERSETPVGMSLHCGLNSVNPDNYDGWDGRLDGCEADAKAINDIAQEQGFTTKLLLTEHATTSAVTSCIREAASVLKAGDMFLWSFSGHGSSELRRIGHYNKTDALLHYDRQFSRDEIVELLSAFAPGVRVLLVTDSDPDAVRMFRASELLEGQISAVVLLLSGCSEGQYANDGGQYGDFTNALLKVWDEGRFTGDYEGFCREIDLEMGDRDQTPQLCASGIDSQEFLAQRPFTILADRDDAPRDGNLETDLPQNVSIFDTGTEEEQRETQNVISALPSLDEKALGALIRICSAKIDLSPEDIDERLWRQINDPEILMVTKDRKIEFEHARIRDFVKELADEPYHGLTILWVDDNPENNANIEAALANSGASIRTTRSTEEALADSEYLQECDLVLSDMSRGGDDTAGYELIYALRNMRPSLPVIIFAGYTVSSPYQRRQIVDYGAFGATNQADELLELVDLAACATTLKKGSRARIAIEGEILQNLPEVGREIEEIPEGEFCTIEEIYEFLADEDELRPSEQIVGSLLIFHTDRQKSWLIASTEKLLFLLDDPETREGRYLVQRTSPISDSSVVEASKNADGLPVVRIGRNNREPAWFYSTSLFAKPDDIEIAIHSLVQKAITAVKQGTIGPRDDDNLASDSNIEIDLDTGDNGRVPKKEVEVSGYSQNDKIDTSEALLDERIIVESEDKSYLPIRQLNELMELSASVGRISIGLKTATGFLIGDQLLITTAHVVPNLEAAGNTIVEFEVHDGLHSTPTKFETFFVDTDAGFLCDRDLDYTILSLKGLKPSLLKISGGLMASKLADKGKLVAGNKVSLIYHPGSRSKQVSINAGTIVDVKDDVLHYEFNTDRGISGAPVLAENFSVIGMHHTSFQGPDDRVLAEAIRWPRIAESIRINSTGLPDEFLRKLGPFYHGK